MFGRLLPRHLQIVFEINRRFLREVSIHFLGSQDHLQRMSLIEEGGQKSIRMAHLGIVGSHSVNGVAELHTKLLVEREFADFAALYPGRFNNKTNGITPRRWLLATNPRLAELITDSIGDAWTKDLDELRALEPYAEDAGFQDRFIGIKRANKERLAAVTREITGIEVDPASIFDIHVKRIHEYKRQLLNVLHVISLWLRLKEDPGADLPPRTFFIGGKAAPGYFMAKKTIQLICHVAEMINKDPDTSRTLKLVFLPNYRVSLAEVIIPAADVSEQISTAGYEASGTGNMKFALNGAHTVGTLDGANIEIREEVGSENIHIFGLTAEEVKATQAHHHPYGYYAKDALLKRAIDLIKGGFFSPEIPELFHPVVSSLLDHDRFLVLADFADYCRCHDEIGKLYREQGEWTRKAILNVARIGRFSSDRTIREYNRDIWRADPVSTSK
jgi:starch phosphorylase